MEDVELLPDEGVTLLYVAVLPGESVLLDEDTPLPEPVYELLPVVEAEVLDVERPLPV